ncbi:LuxR C-terminal-related transcriptional regulator [Candidatus Pyrohabitans sp.]
MSGVGILTERQAQVLRYAAMGYTQGEIASALEISQPRVSSVLKAAQKKIALAKKTMEFYEELKYIKELRERGFHGDAVLR